MDPRTFGILGVDLRNRFVDLHRVVKSPASSNEKSARCGRRLEQPRSCRLLLAPASDLQLSPTFVIVADD